MVISLCLSMRRDVGNNVITRAGDLSFCLSPAELEFQLDSVERLQSVERPEFDVIIVF